MNGPRVLSFLVLTIVFMGLCTAAYLTWATPRIYYIVVTVGETQPHTSVLDFLRDLVAVLVAKPRTATTNATEPTYITVPATLDEVDDVWDFVEYANAHKDEVNTHLSALAQELGVELPEGNYAVFVEVVRENGEAVYLTVHYSNGKFEGITYGWEPYPGETVVAKITRVKEEFLIKCFKLLMEGKYEELNDEVVHGYFAKSYIIEEVSEEIVG
ncbi:MAG: hypothetical protein DRO23_09870 [Thermoprotei archaeon]|nr:MAG: hypothetical protein DRO23_09870 [Thermoprotei archaeon]